MSVVAAELSTTSRNSLPDSAFALVYTDDSGNKVRALPINDEGHVRNALSRFNQTGFPSSSVKASAKAKVKAAASKFDIEVSDDFAEWARFAEPLLVAGPMLEVELPAEFGEVVRLPYLRTGEWTFAGDYGEIQITDGDLDAIVQNFDRDARRQDIAVTALPWNEEHAVLPPGADARTYVGAGAVGWIKGLQRDGDTVFADVELNRLGEQLMRDDRYRAVSPELLLDWTDPETLESWGKTAVGGAFTTRPRMKGLAHRDGPMTDLAASEARVLAFADRPASYRRAVAAEGTPPGAHDPFSGSHSHPHPAFGAQGGDDTHSHSHSHDGDADHDHTHKMAEGAAGAQPLAGTELASVHIDQPLTTLSISYAYPGAQRLPLHTAEAVKGSRSRFMTVEASEEERDQAWARLAEAAWQHGVEVPASWRDLTAHECAVHLMQEGLDDYFADLAQDASAGLQAPCCYQPPYSDLARCPGFTRSDPDGDGDSDCCAMAAKGCNGYIPLLSVQPPATFVSPQSATYYRERTRSGGPMSDRNQQTSREGEGAVRASEPAAAATGAAPAATTPTPAAPDPAAPATQQAATAAQATAPADTQAASTVAAPAAPEATAQPSPPPAPAPSPLPAPPVPLDSAQHAAANRAELESILAAERLGREDLARRLAAAEQAVSTERDARLRMETATRMAEVATRVQRLVESGRIAPAQRDLLMKDPARFAEDASFIEVLEAAPANSVVDMRERGTGTEESVPESQRLESAAKALMSERSQSVDPNHTDFFKNYKAALLDVGRTGYRAR